MTDGHARVIVRFPLFRGELRPGRAAHGRARKARQFHEAVLRIGMPQSAQMGEARLAAPVLVAAQLHHIALVAWDQGPSPGQGFRLVITQEDDDQARRLLREHRDGSCPRTRAPATAPEVSLSDDARFVLRAEHVLRQAGGRGDPFLGVKLVDPTWTRAHWEQAQAALAQWQQQGRARQQGSGLEALEAAPDEEHRTNKQD